MQKAALKAQAAELKKMEKEMQKWEKGKFALNSIVAEFDTRVIEHGSVGGKNYFFLVQYISSFKLQ